MVCNFFKEDAKKRHDPRLERQGIEWFIDICNLCYEGLIEYKGSMRNWIGSKVRIGYTKYGPLSKLESIQGLYISNIYYVELREVTLDFKKDYGYLYGTLEHYAFEHKGISMIPWKLFQFADGQVLKTIKRFMLIDKKGYIQ